MFINSGLQCSWSWAVGREKANTPDRSPDRSPDFGSITLLRDNGSYTYTYTHTRPIHLTQISLDCRREPDNLEETQPCKLHKERSQLASGFDPSTFLVGGMFYMFLLSILRVKPHYMDKKRTEPPTIHITPTGAARPLKLWSSLHTVLFFLLLILMAAVVVWSTGDFHTLSTSALGDHVTLRGVPLYG